MQDLIQETARGISIPAASYSAAHTAEWINMENHAKVTFTIATGAVTGGTKLKIQCATSASGSGAANVAAPFDGGIYYKHTTTTVPTKTSASSSTSVDYIVIGASSSAVYYATVDASVLAAGKPYVSLVAKGASASSALMCGTFECWGTRYQQEAMLDVLA